MKNLNKKFLSLFLCFALVIGIFIPTYVKANEKITIDLKRNHKIDIVLTAKDTSLDLSNFEDDILIKLEKEGFDTNLINLQTVSSEEVSTNATDAATVFNSWNKFGNAGKWSLTTYSGSKVIYNSENTWGLTGYYSPENMDLRDMTLEYEFMSSDTDNDFVGVILRFNMNEDHTKLSDPLNTRVSGYWYMETGPSNSPWCNLNGLYKVKNSILPKDSDNSSYSKYDALGGAPSMHWNGKSYITSNYSTLWSEQEGVTPLNINSSYIWAKKNTWIKYKFEIKNNTITVWRNGTQVLSHMDTSDNPINTGSFALINMSQASRYRNFVASYSFYKTFVDILRKPNWREDANHFIVNVDNSIDDGFVNPTTKGEILTRTINDNINFIQWGSNENKTIMENFIIENNDNGIYLDGSNYEEVLQKTIDYIVSFYNQQENDNQYVIIDTPTNLLVTPENLASNTSDSDYPNGKWIIHHNAKYFANGTGQSEYSEQYQDDLNVVFDKPGEYDIYFGEDLVKTIYAHRKPIANFSMSLNSDKTLNLVNQSYDLDSNENKYGLGNGIKEIQWQWKNLNDSEWTIGKPTFALVDGESYVIQLIVIDEQNVQSCHMAKFLTLDNTIEIPPIASFNFANSTIFTSNELEILDSSYDPLGNILSTYEWVLKKGETIISTSSTPTLSFDSVNLGAGDYSYTLRVQNNNGLWSETYTKYFKVIEDNIAPSVTIEPTYSDWGDSSAINFEFMDSGSGFAKFRYTHSATQTPPSDTDTSWSEWSTNDNGSLNISEDGVWYLHLQAYDNNNNLLTRTVGVYRIDTSNPIIDSVIIDDSSIEREIPITIIGHDDTSGIKYYRFVNESTNEDSGYIETNVYNAKSNGVYTIYIKDKNNNEVSTQSEEITIVDRVAPNVVTLKVDTNTSEWTTNLETTIKAEDTFSGMNTYSYSLEKVENSTKENLLVDTKNNNPFLLNVYAEENVIYNPLTIDMDTFDINAYQWQENDTFSVTKNGTYNLYARDNANNVSGVQFTIVNIDTTAPTIESITKSNENVTNEDIVITIIGANDDQSGLHEKPYSYDNGNTWTSNNTYVVTNNTNGEVNVLVRDAIENIATFTYSIDNIDKTLPSFEDLSVTNNREEKKANIYFSFSDDRELYGYVLKTNSSLPQDNEYITNFEINNGVVSSEYEVNKNGIYYLFIKDKAGNIYPQKLQIDALVSGIDFSQDKVTEYQTIGEESNISLYNTRNQITNEGDFDTYVYVSQQSTFSVVVPKVLVLDGQTGYADYQVSVLGNIAGKETIGVIPNDSFEMKDSDGIKSNIVATVSQDKTSFAYDEIVNKTTTNGNIFAPSITAGRWNGISNFNILVQNSLNIKDSIASIPEDSFALQVDNSAIILK